MFSMSYACGEPSGHLVTEKVQSYQSAIWVFYFHYEFYAQSFYILRWGHSAFSLLRSVALRDIMPSKLKPSQSQNEFEPN